ncbi:disulfide bond formation protein B [Kordiimonas marina]|uniref:disulfide bond formation protein B n=1 Tax=Kordiimonas marina TaxID=2872312 RepID=UPI001FF59333|nr:disulfide bond formation protein B [Kordiimonas marina]MCJ9428429.1 disulfide bond formation protein B [Kordiimonas marina]
MPSTLMSMPNRQPVLFAGLAALVILGSAYGFQAAGYAPCDLCWLQRYPYMAIIPIAFIAHFIKAPVKPVLILLGLLFLADAGIAAYHVGVEQKWWQGPTECTASGLLSDDPAEALKAIMNAPLVRCDEIAWSLFGISMAGYNFIVALGLALFSLIRSRKG